MNNRGIVLRFLCCVLYCLYAAGGVLANTSAAELTIYNNYLNQLTSAEANFTQTAAGAKTQFGKFYLQKPGKMRWDYLQPKPFTLVINGKNVTHYDKILDEATYGRSDEVALHFLSKPMINLAQDVNVLSVDNATDGTVNITLMPKITKDKQADDYSKYKLRLVFKTKPLRLAEMITIDENNHYTVLTLHNLRNGVQLDNKLFYIANPKLARKSGQNY